MRSRRGALIVRIVIVLTAAMAWPAVRASADPVPVGVFLEAQPAVRPRSPGIDALVS